MDTVRTGGHRDWIGIGCSNRTELKQSGSDNTWQNKTPVESIGTRLLSLSLSLSCSTPTIQLILWSPDAEIYFA
jgi:hypothetical protein